MIPVRTLMTSLESFCEPIEGQDIPLLSIVLLCRLPEEEKKVEELIVRLCSRKADVEMIIVFEPDLQIPSREPRFAAWYAQQGCRLMISKSPCGLAAIRLNEGILASRGRWVWLLDAQNKLPSINLDFILTLLRGLPVNTVPILAHPDDYEKFLHISGSKLLWVDMFYRGFQFPFENIFFTRNLFDTYGLLDPHIVMAAFFQQEFLFRICRDVKFEKIDTMDANAGVHQATFPSIFYHWIDIDRQTHLKPKRINDYQVDDLEQFHKGIPRSERWNAYLNYVLPYYHAFGHQLPDGLPEKIQSIPPISRHILCIKSVHYDTTTDVGIRNFDVFAQGERYFKLSYVYSGQIEVSGSVTDDAILLLRTVGDAALDLAKRESRSGLPVGHALDDDLLNLYQAGGEFASFCPGNPFYDATAKAIKLADVVLCGGIHIMKSVEHLNRRTVHFEGSVLPEFLPEMNLGRKRKPFKFGYAGGGYRVEEMQFIWPAIERICQEYGDQVRFEFWGLDPKKLSGNLQQVSFLPFTISYYEYLSRLKLAEFDAMLIPLVSGSVHRKGKLPNKLYETAVAGAVGLYSDVPTYYVVKANRLGLIVHESTEAWYRAMRSIIGMSEEEYSALYTRSQAFVREFYTTPAMLPVHEHGLEAILFHGRTRASRTVDGRPCVMYLFSGTIENLEKRVEFERLLELAEKSAISPLVIMPHSVKDFPEWELLRNYLETRHIPYEFVFYHSFVSTFTSNIILPTPEEEASIRQLLTRRPIALLHSVGYNVIFGKLCAELGIPHITSPGVIGDYPLPKGRLPYRACDLAHSDSIRDAKKWGQLFDSHWFCFRGIVPESLYEIGFERLYGKASPEHSSNRIRIGIIGTLLSEKYQLETIRAVSKVIELGCNVQLDIFGEMTSDPDFYDRCRELISKLKMWDRFSFRGDVENLKEIYPALDILVSACRSDSVPIDAKEAMASGTLVVLIQVEPKPELMRDSVNGILISDSEAEHISEALMRAINLQADETLRLRRNAYRMARREFHFRKGLAELLSMYNLCLQTHARKTSGQPICQTETAPNVRMVASTLPSPGSHIRLSCRLTYHIVPQHSQWMGLDVLVGAHQRPASGVLRLRVLSDAGQLLREVSGDLSHAYDNNWVEFRFDPIVNTCGRSFTLEFAVMNSRPQTLISLYESNPPEGFLRRILRGVGLLRSGNSLYCSMRYLERD